ncbi:MAG TPA: hypothetical protein PKD55_20220 [Bellilinea sp.]|nr:hypothetical protein [Bellilinea sp.]
MSDDGKLTDVLIEENWGPNWKGEHVLFGLIVWADPGMEAVIAKVPGVVSVEGVKTNYAVHLDPRYDREWVKREIVAQIKCAPGGE